MDAMMTRNRTRERAGGVVRRGERIAHAPLSGLLGIDEALSILAWVLGRYGTGCV